MEDNSRSKLRLIHNRVISEAEIKVLYPDEIKEGVDVLATESPLDLSLRYWNGTQWLTHQYSVLMRTPGADRNLVLGLLFAEGIISEANQVEKIQLIDNAFEEEKIDKAVVFLSKQCSFSPTENNRNLISNSSCGFCGKDTLESLQHSCYILPRIGIQLEKNAIWNLKGQLINEQSAFNLTGGIHAVAAVNAQGEIEVLKEDVGRHNALDKVVGCLLEEGQPPFTNKGLLLSGRASFEMVHKAMMAGFPVVIAIGAPSSMAVDFAEENNMTLIGFLKENRMNIYSAQQRVVF